MAIQPGQQQAGSSQHQSSPYGSQPYSGSSSESSSELFGSSSGSSGTLQQGPLHSQAQQKAQQTQGTNAPVMPGGYTPPFVDLQQQQIQALQLRTGREVGALLLGTWTQWAKTVYMDQHLKEFSTPERQEVKQFVQQMGGSISMINARIPRQLLPEVTDVLLQAGASIRVMDQIQSQYADPQSVVISII